MTEPASWRSAAPPARGNAPFGGRRDDVARLDDRWSAVVDDLHQLHATLRMLTAVPITADPDHIQVPMREGRVVELFSLRGPPRADQGDGPAAFYRSVFAYRAGDEALWTRTSPAPRRPAGPEGDPFSAYLSGCIRYAHRYATGDYADARSSSGELEQFNREAAEVAEGSWSLRRFMLARATGGREQIRPLLTAAEGEGRWLPGLLAVYTELEMWPAAARTLTLLRGQLEEECAGAMWGGALVFMVEAAVALQDVATASILRPLVAAHAGGNLVAGQFLAVFGSADRRVADLDSVLGAKGADEHFAQALAMDRRMGALTHQAETLAAWSRHRARVGGQDGPSATTLAHEAEVLARTVGHHGVLRDLGCAPAPVARHTSLPGGLSPREVDVLRLVADGLSNREIGERLFLSPHTVANHVRSILAKTSSPNRTRAAVFAAEQDLLGHSS